MLAVAAKRLRVPYPIAFVIGGIALGICAPSAAAASELPISSCCSSCRRCCTARRGRRIGSSSNATRGRSRSMPLDWSSSRWPRSPRSSITPCPAFTWPLAFTLGAIVSPPDAVAAEAIFERIAVPRRIAAIVSGECLVNDATALVLYRFALAAAITGAFSLVASGRRVRRRRRRRHSGRHRGGLRFRGSPSLHRRGAASAIR